MTGERFIPPWKVCSTWQKCFLPRCIPTPTLKPQWLVEVRANYSRLCVSAAIVVHDILLAILS